MKKMDAYEQTLAGYEVECLKRNGIISIFFEAPLLMIDRADYKAKIALLSHKFEEPILLVTGDIEQMYFPLAKSDGGGWAPAISREMEKVMSDQELSVAGALAEPFGRMESKVILRAPKDVDMSVLFKRQQDLLEKGLRIELDPDTAFKIIRHGFLADAEFDAAPAEALEMS